jgi:hypothetical protein
MNDTPPPLPSSPPPLPSSAARPKSSSLAAWLCWIVACTLFPASPFLIFGQNNFDAKGNEVFLVLLLAVAAQIACSVWVPMSISKGGRRGPGFVIGLSFALLFASVAIGTASFFGACVAANPRMDFR